MTKPTGNFKVRWGRRFRLPTTLLCALLLSACTTPRKEFFVAFSQCNNAEPYRAAQNALMTKLFAEAGGVKLVIADDHKGLHAAASKVFHATLQRCRVHWMRNAMAHVPAKQRPAVMAMIKTIFAQETAADAHAQWKTIADALRERAPRLAELMDEAREDVLAYTAFPKEHWPQIASTNPLERLNGEVKRRSDVVGIFPNEDAIIRLIGAVLLEANDEWQLQHRYMQTEAMAELAPPTIDAVPNPPSGFGWNRLGCC